MKKIFGIVLLMISISGITFGAKEELKNENGKYSGSASIGLVAMGRVIDRIPQSMLVLKVEDENGVASDVMNFTHNGVKANEERKSKGKFVAQIYREDKYGKMNLVDLDKNIRTEIVTADNRENSERALKTLNGNEIGKISYELGKSKNLKNKYESEIINRVAINDGESGVFIDNNSSLKVVIEDLAMAY